MSERKKKHSCPFTMEPQTALTTTPHPGGRPTKYNAEMLKKTEQYYIKCRDTNTIPYKEKLALTLDIDDDTLVEWSQRYPEFSATVKKIEILQRYTLMHAGLTRQGNPVMAIFLLKANHKMIETERVQHSGYDGQPIKFNIIAGGYLPEPVQVNGAPETGNILPAEIQDTHMAPAGTQDDNSNNGVGETGVN